jgi:hypothetical protein
MSKKIEKSCPRPCSFCGRLDLPPSEIGLKYGHYKPGEKIPVCFGFREACSEDIHPCGECVLYAPRPWSKGWKVGEVKYQDKLLGRIPVPDKDDSEDPEGVMGHIGREVLMQLLEKNKAPAGMVPQEWILWTLRGIGQAMFGKRHAQFEEQVMRRHLRHYGALSGMETLIKLCQAAPP